MTETVPALVAEFRAIMSDETYTAGIPSAEMCRAVIEFVAAGLSEGPEMWALWHVPHDSETASLCEFDGSTCYECYADANKAWHTAERLNRQGYSQGGRYVVARVPNGVAASFDNGKVRASGPAVEWQAGFESGWTTCTARIADLDVLATAPARSAPTARDRYRETHRAERAAYVRLIDRPAPENGAPICRLVVFGQDDGAEQGRVIQDIIESDMSAEQFQRHFMGPGMLARTYGAGEFFLSVGFYHEGTAFFPFFGTTKGQTCSRF